MASERGDAPWTLLDRREVHRNRVFAVETRHMRRPAPDERSGDFFVMTTPSWVNVVALTARDELVLVEQFRHGVQRRTLEIPGGVIDPGEDPFEAARRELAEETGYASDAWYELGAIEPNPAIIDNQCHTFLALDAVVAGEQALDENEDCRVVVRPWGEVAGLVTAGAITHALVVVALHYEHLRRSGSLVPKRR